MSPLTPSVAPLPPPASPNTPGRLSAAVLDCLHFQEIPSVARFLRLLPYQWSWLMNWGKEVHAGWVGIYKWWKLVAGPCHGTNQSQIHFATGGVGVNPLHNCFAAGGVWITNLRNRFAKRVFVIQRLVFYTTRYVFYTNYWFRVHRLQNGFATDWPQPRRLQNGFGTDWFHGKV